MIEDNARLLCGTCRQAGHADGECRQQHRDYDAAAEARWELLMSRDFPDLQGGDA